MPRLTLALSASVGGLAFVLYALTLHRTVPAGDSGELITAAFTLGVAHPPGYPLYTLLAHAFTWLPFGSVALRVNLFSAFADALAAGLLVFTVARWSGRPWAAVAAGASFAFSPLVWRYAVVAEVFALNNLFVVALLCVAVELDRAPSRRLAMLGAFLFGLGMSHHHSLVFFGLPLSAWVLWRMRSELLSPKRIALLVGAFAAGLLPYLYLPLASAQQRWSSWGEAHTWSGFWTHLLRREYGTFQLAAQRGETTPLLSALGAYFRSLVAETYFLGIALALVGLAFGLRSKPHRQLTRVTLAAFAFYLVVFHALANLPLDNALYFDVHSRFWQQANVLVFAWTGLGLAFVLERLPTPSRAQVASCAFAALGALGFRSADERGNRTIHDLGRSLVEPVPPGALLVTQGDVYLNSVRYLREVERVRPDVCVLDRQLMKARWHKAIAEKNCPGLVLPGTHYAPSERGAFDLRALFDANPSRAIFVSGFERADDKGWEPAYTTYPFGLLNQVAPKDRPFGVREYIARSDGVLAAFDVKSLERARPGAWEALIRDDYWEADHRRGRRLLAYAAEHDDLAALQSAARILSGLLERHPRPPRELYRNVGIAYSRLLPHDPGAPAQMVRAWSEYLKSPSPSDADLEAIRKAVEAYRGAALH